jgi:Tetratricopeptide repeat
VEVKQNTETKQLKRAFCQIMNIHALQITDRGILTATDIVATQLTVPHLEETAQKLVRFICNDDFVNIFMAIIGYYSNQKMFAVQEKWCCSFLDATQNRFGENHLNVAISLRVLALVYQAQKRYTKVEPLLQYSLSIRKKCLGDRHPDVAAILRDLASFYLVQERYNEVELLYQYSLSILEKHGNSDSDAATEN